LRVVRTWAGHTSVEIDFTAKPFDDVRVRQALAYATPYREVLERGKLGQGRAWRSPMKGTSQWYTDAYWHYETNVDRARELLKAAGFASGLRSDMYVPSRPDCVRIGEIL